MQSLWLLSWFPWQRVAAYNEAYEPWVPITSKVWRSPPWLSQPLKNMCHKWRRICSVCRKHNPVFSSFMTYHFICQRSNTTGATNGARTDHPWLLVALSLVFCSSLFFLLSFLLSVLFRFTASDYPFGFVKHFWKPLN